MIVWVERDSTGHSARDPLTSDTSLHPIPATDPLFADDFWRGVVGATVRAISIVVRKPATARLAELPNEVGLCFTLNSGSKLVAVHGLHDDSDDFAIITEYRIPKAVRASLREIPVVAP